MKPLGRRLLPRTKEAVTDMKATQLKAYMMVGAILVSGLQAMLNSTKVRPASTTCQAGLRTTTQSGSAGEQLP